MRKQKGFSLIELLIVVAIILIIAAIAIPNLLRARMAANESSAAGGIRTVNTAEISYLTAYGQYAGTLPILGQAAATGTCTPSSTSACLIDGTLSLATSAAKAKSGYVYGMGQTGGIQDYTVGAAPAVVNQSGVKSYCSNADSVVRALNPGTSATPAVASTTCNTYTPL